MYPLLYVLFVGVGLYKIEREDERERKSRVGQGVSKSERQVQDYRAEEAAGRHT